MTNKYVKYDDFVINSNQDNKQKSYSIQCPCDLDLWPSDPKIYRGHVLVMTNLYVKDEDIVINTFQGNKQKPFWHLVTPKSIGVINSYIQSICETWRLLDE
jgi:hypothetical protein